MIEYPLDKIACMGGWFIPEKLCDDIISSFNLNKHLHSKGVAVSQGDGKPHSKEVDFDIKESTDMRIGQNAVETPFNDYRFFLQKCLNEYLKKYDDLNLHPKFNVNEPYNVQYYKPNEGFKKWHFENASKRERLLVFMTYLNDCDDGGTEFKYQDLITPAKKGLTLIWPADWTHTHRGIVSHTKEKKIITGWINFFQPTERLEENK